MLADWLPETMSKDERCALTIRAWREYGIAVIDVDALYSEFDRRQIERIATRLYGPRPIVSERKRP